MRCPGSESAIDIKAARRFAEPAAAVIGLSDPGPPEPPWWNINKGIYCWCSRPRRPYTIAALQLGKTPSCLYFYGRLGSRAPLGPNHQGRRPAKQAVTEIIKAPHAKPSEDYFTVAANMYALSPSLHISSSKPRRGGKDGSVCAHPPQCAAHWHTPSVAGGLAFESDGAGYGAKHSISKENGR